MRTEGRHPAARATENPVMPVTPPISAPLRAAVSAPSAGAASAAAKAHFATERGDASFTGGDGTYSVPIADGRTAWLFGDSFVGGVQPDGSRSNDPKTFVRNSIVFQDGDDFRLVTGREDGAPVDAARPPGMAENRNGLGPDQWYWPGHGTTRGDDLHVFMNRFDHPKDRPDPLAWDWRYGGTDLATFDAKTGALRATNKVFGAGDVLWGAAVLERGGHTYVYGAEDDPAGKTRHAHVARVERDRLLEPDAYRFWDGGNWVADQTRSARVGPRVSPQFGAFQAKDGSTVLVTQDGFEHAVRAWRADSPEGPYDGGEVVAEIPRQPNDRHTYNAVPHPHLAPDGDPGGLLVSFNVGGADFMNDHTSYRPSFVEVPAGRLPGGGIDRTSPTPAA